MTDNKALIAQLNRQANTPHRNADWPLMLEAADALEAAAARETILFDAIAHGDDEHRAWLKQAIEDHFAGRPVQKSSGRNSAEIIAELRARIARLEAVAEAAKTLGHDRVDGMSEYWDDGKLRSALTALEAK